MSKTLKLIKNDMSFWKIITNKIYTQKYVSMLIKNGLTKQRV